MSMENSKKDTAKALAIGALLMAGLLKLMKMLNKHFEEKK